MQNRYTGDIGDFIKISLLRSICQGRHLGVVWYLYPDEDHNKDGRHIDYLRDPNKWRHFDPAVFDAVNEIVRSGDRRVGKLEPLLSNAVFFDSPLDEAGYWKDRAQWRQYWFGSAVMSVDSADIVFADPDNGLRLDEGYEYHGPGHWKSIPLSEALTLARNRTAVIYHHNTRLKGGHRLEISRWLATFGVPAVALYCRPRSPRTFFILNPDEQIRQRCARFAEKWGKHVELVSEPGEPIRTKESSGSSTSQSPRKREGKAKAELKTCPACGQLFRGPGWLGIDAHWKSKHTDLMPYVDAWPLIKAETWRNPE